MPIQQTDHATYSGEERRQPQANVATVLGRIDERLVSIETKVDARIKSVESRMDMIVEKVGHVEAMMTERMGMVTTETDRQIENLSETHNAISANIDNKVSKVYKWARDAHAFLVSKMGKVSGDVKKLDERVTLLEDKDLKTKATKYDKLIAWTIGIIATGAGAWVISNIGQILTWILSFIQQFMPS